jgi:hypothetical protein
MSYNKSALNIQSEISYTLMHISFPNYSSLYAYNWNILKLL